MTERRPSNKPPMKRSMTLRGLRTPTLRGIHQAPEGGPTETVPTTPLHQILKEMRKLRSRDALLELVLIAVRPAAPKTALFAVKKDAFVGRICTGDFGDRAQFAQVSIPSNVPTVLATVAAGGRYVGPLVRNDAHAPLFKFIKSKKPEIVVASIRAGTKAAVLLLSHEVGDSWKAEPVIGEVVRVAGETLEAIVREKREHA